MGIDRLGVDYRIAAVKRICTQNVRHELEAEERKCRKEGMGKDKMCDTLIEFALNYSRDRMLQSRDKSKGEKDVDMGAVDGGCPSNNCGSEHYGGNDFGGGQDGNWLGVLQGAIDMIIAKEKGFSFREKAKGISDLVEKWGSEKDSLPKEQECKHNN